MPGILRWGPQGYLLHVETLFSDQRRLLLSESVLIFLFLLEVVFIEVMFFDLWFGRHAGDDDLEGVVLLQTRLQHLVVLLHGLAVVFDVVDVVVSADLGVWSRQVTFDLGQLEVQV